MARLLQLKIDFNSLEETWANIAEISKKEVIRTVTDPTMQQKVQITDLTILFFLRKEPKIDTYLLILGQLTREKVFELGLCLRIRADLIEKVGTAEPLILLRQIADNFGVNQRIGDKVSKFFLRESIPVPASSEKIKLIDFDVSEVDELAHYKYTRYRKEPGVIDCALSIAIDISKYNAWLNQDTNFVISAKKYDVFISYKRNTAKDLAKNLKNCLTQEGYTTFLDLTDIPKEFENTQKWFEVRDEAIKNSKRFCLIITIKLETSQEVPKELALAKVVPNMKFMYLRHDALKPQIILKTNKGDVIDLSEGNQEVFSNEDDLVRKVLLILQESTK